MSRLPSVTTAGMLASILNVTAQAMRDPNAASAPGVKLYLICLGMVFVCKPRLPVCSFALDSDSSSDCRRGQYDARRHGAACVLHILRSMEVPP